MTLWMEPRRLAGRISSGVKGLGAPRLPRLVWLLAGPQKSREEGGSGAGVAGRGVVLVML